MKVEEGFSITDIFPIESEAKPLDPFDVNIVLGPACVGEVFVVFKVSLQNLPAFPKQAPAAPKIFRTQHPRRPPTTQHTTNTKDGNNLVVPFNRVACVGR